MFLDHTNAEDIFASLEKPKKLELKPRTTFLKVGTVATVKGSAYMEYGNTKVLAQVDTPKELTSQTRRSTNASLCVVNCTLKFAPFGRAPQSDLTQKESYMSMILKKALEPMICRHEYPNFQLDIDVQILDDDGCALSTAITCCGVALVEAGVATYDLITASTVCIYRGIVFVNPSSIVEQLLEYVRDEDADAEHGLVVTSSLSTIEQISECFQVGYLTPETMQNLIEHSIEINKALLDTVRYVLVKKVEHFIAEESEETVIIS